MNHRGVTLGGLALCAALVPMCLAGCSSNAGQDADTSSATDISAATTFDEVNDIDDSSVKNTATKQPEQKPQEPETKAEEPAPAPSADAIKPAIVEDYRSSFVHGDKPAANQKYIVLHDTEGDGDAASVIDWWDSNGNLVAAHFVVNKDGTIWQCVPLDKITHHAGYGDTGHNAQFGITEDGRDDMLGSVPIGDWASDYGMNAWSIGIEMVHVGGSGDYPEEQLKAVDALIAYIDAYYGFESTIIDHKDWRSGNSDTSPEFAPYFENYKNTRTHDGS